MDETTTSVSTAWTTAVSVLAMDRCPRKDARIKMSDDGFKRLAAAIAVVAMALSSGCAERPADNLGPPRPITTAEAARLHDAEETLLRDCMAEIGFTYHPMPMEPVPDRRVFPYGIDDVDWAERHGYGTDIEQELVRLNELDPNRRYFASLPPQRQAAALVAMNGQRPVGLSAPLPTGGVLQRSDRSCTSTAERTLYGDLEAWYRVENITDNLVALWRPQVLADPAYVTAVGQWSRCMENEGHRYSSPAETRAALGNPDHPAPMVEQVRVATAEAKCALSTGLSSTAKALEQRYSSQIRQQYGADVAARIRLEWEALPRARRILAG